MSRDCRARIPTPRLALTLALLQWQLYHTSEVPRNILQISLQHTCYTQTDNHFMTTSYQCQGQRQTRGQTGSSIQYQMLVRLAETLARHRLNTNK